MEKVNGFILSAISGFVITWVMICFVIWKFDPSEMTEGQRFTLAWLSAWFSALSVCFYGICKKN